MMDIHGPRYRYITQILTIQDAAPAVAFCVGCYSVAGGATVRVAARAPRFAAISPRTAMAAMRGAGAPSRWPFRYNVSA